MKDLQSTSYFLKQHVTLYMREENGDENIIYR